MTFLELFRTEFDDEMKKTRKILERVPEDKFAWKPHEKSMLLGRLASHVAEMPGRAALIATADELLRQPGQVPFSAATHAELIDKFEKGFADGRSAIAGLTDEQLSKIWTLKFGDQIMAQMPKAMALRTVVMNHMIHHRAQLGVYLRLLEIPVPGMFGPSADEKR
jgi:uncharacterized damage-inducible protein DinB